jgi:CheY-like chemotaxis protein
VDVISEGRNRGAEFTVKLPAVEGKAAAQAAADIPERAELHTGCRVLIVDDNEDAADLMAEALESMGHSTRVAYDGPQALRVVGDFVPDVALVDIGLPVMDGHELARRLRESPRLARLRLVAVTGYGQESDRQRSREAGFDAHLVKPVDVDRLADVITEACRP